MTLRHLRLIGRTRTPFPQEIYDPPSRFCFRTRSRCLAHLWHRLVRDEDDAEREREQRAPLAQVEPALQNEHREDGRREDLHLRQRKRNKPVELRRSEARARAATGRRTDLCDDGKGGGVDVLEREEAQNVHREVDGRRHKHGHAVPDEVEVLGDGRACRHVRRRVGDDNLGWGGTRGGR